MALSGSEVIKEKWSLTASKLQPSWGAGQPVRKLVPSRATRRRYYRKIEKLVSQSCRNDYENLINEMTIYLDLTCFQW